MKRETSIIAILLLALAAAAAFSAHLYLENRQLKADNGALRMESDRVRRVVIEALQSGDMSERLKMMNQAELIDVEERRRRTEAEESRGLKQSP